MVADITVNLGSPPDLDSEERRQRALRAAEVLNGASWVFDEFVSAIVRDLIFTDPGDREKRENLHYQVDAATQLKGRLMQIIQLQQAEEKVNERKHRSEPSADHE